MPMINITTGKLSVEKKRELIEGITKTASEVMGVPKEFYSIAILEIEDENMGIAGESVADLKKRLGNK